MPFDAKKTSRLIHQQVAEMPLRLRIISSDIPESLDNMVLKLLSKEPELRYQSAKGLLYDLERYERGESLFVIGEKDQKRKLSYQTRLVGRENELGDMVGGVIHEINNPLFAIRMGMEILHEYEEKLKAKLQEEVDEFIKDSNEEELADILEVIYALCDFYKIDKNKLEETRIKKRKKRGGFKNKIILQEVKK